MAQRKKALQEEAGDEALESPPKPNRYELWAMARTKPSGSYTSDAVASVVSKIVSVSALFNIM